MKYIFYLGRIPSLAVAELQAVLDKMKIKHSVYFAHSRMLILKISSSIDFKTIFPQMGGTIKIALVIDEYRNISDVFEKATSIIKKLNAEQSGKRIIGYSVYFTQNMDKNKVGAILADIKHRFIKIKKVLAGKIKMRIVFPNKDMEIKTASVLGNKMLERGAEFNFVFFDSRVVLAKTIITQDIKSYSMRDCGRPVRELRVGMIPPKLAQIMLNLANVKNGQTVFDPFCGAGTILQESLLCGYKVIGSDADSRQVCNCRTNIEWLLHNFNVRCKDYKVFQSDVGKAFKKIKDNSLDAIVTESILGPVYKTIPSKMEIRKNYKDIEKVYLRFFQAAKPALKKKSRIVITAPAYKIKDQYVLLPFVDRLRKIGYASVNLLDRKFTTKKIKQTKRNSIIYDRANQIVAREVMVFEKS